MKKITIILSILMLIPINIFTISNRGFYRPTTTTPVDLSLQANVSNCLKDEITVKINKEIVKIPAGKSSNVKILSVPFNVYWQTNKNDQKRTYKALKQYSGKDLSISIAETDEAYLMSDFF